MKKVTIEGKEFEVPDKANYVAMDENCIWRWFESYPKRWHDCWLNNGGDSGIIETYIAWEDTLRKI